MYKIYVSNIILLGYRKESFPSSFSYPFRSSHMTSEQATPPPNLSSSAIPITCSPDHGLTVTTPIHFSRMPPLQEPLTARDDVPPNAPSGDVSFPTNFNINAHFWNPFTDANYHKWKFHFNTIRLLITSTQPTNWCCHGS